MCKKDVNIHSKDVNIPITFRLRSDYVQLRSITFGLRSTYANIMDILRKKIAFFKVILGPIQKNYIFSNSG